MLNKKPIINNLQMLIFPNEQTAKATLTHTHTHRIPMRNDEAFAFELMIKVQK